MSTKEYGCFFCSGKSQKQHGVCPECGRPIDVGKELSQIAIDEYQTTDILGRGFYGWTLKVNDGYQNFALKLLPTQRLERAEVPDSEARALVACSPHRNIARFVRPLNRRFTVLNKQVDVLCLVFDYVENATPLSKLLSDQNFRPTKTDVIDILAGIASGLARMHARGLWHDDLHDDNILVREIAPDENLSERYEPKLIDFGSAKALRPEEPEHGERSDYAYLSKHVFNLAACFEKANLSVLVPADRSFIQSLRRIGERLSDADVSRRNLKPADLVTELRNLITSATVGNEFPSFEEMKNQSHVSLSEPLANANAINLAPQDIALLFRDSLRWSDRIEKSEPVLVVGPRGCGKTMLLRYHSISSQGRPTKNENTVEEVEKRLVSMHYVAFLVRIGGLRTPFIRSPYKKLQGSNEPLAEDFCREFINIHFLYEVLKTLSWLYSERLAAISKDELTQLIPVGLSLLAKGGGPPSIGYGDLLELVERRVVDLSNLSDPLGYSPSNLAGDDVLYHLARSVKSLRWAREKEVWFLLDDYTPMLIPTFAINAYNPAIFRLSSDVKIKFSSEGDGPVMQDSLGRRYKESRELTKVNLGEVYFQASEETCLEFFEKILEARFEETGKGSLEELKAMLGEHESDGNFGKYILEQKRPGDSRFYGFRLLCRLCSGDVSYILELLYSLVAGRWGSSQKIDKMWQDETVKQFAQRQLAALRSTAAYGTALYEFAEGLGNLLKQYLLTAGKADKPDERLRIEIEGTNELSEKAKEMQDELFKHSVLVPGGTGKSRKGLPTTKVYFRRLYAPCFPFSPTRKGCIDLTVQEYERWLLNPKNIWSSPQTPEPPLLGT